MPRTRIGPKKKIAFVCSGGGSKAGAFHLGVALALQEQGFKFLGGLLPKDSPRPEPGPMEISMYVGSSAGSIICSYLAAGYSLENIFSSFSGQEPTHPIDYRPKKLARLTYQKMFKLRAELATEQVKQIFVTRKIFSELREGNFSSLFQFKWLRTTGLFSSAGMEQYMREDVLESNRFDEYNPDLFIIGTQLNHSCKVVFSRYNHKPLDPTSGCEYSNEAMISQACAASATVPFLFAPYEITSSSGKSVHFIDGEIRDTLSSHVAADAGADLIIASYTHQPYHYVKRVGSLTNYGVTDILVQAIYLVIEKKIEQHIHARVKQKDAIEAVNTYCKQHGLPDEDRIRIVELLQAKLGYRPELDIIYIHPRPTDSNMFLSEHFSLSPKKMTEIARSGFKSAIDVLRHYEFTERQRHVPVEINSDLKDAVTKEH